MDPRYITDPKRIKPAQNWNRAPGSLTTQVRPRFGIAARGFLNRILGR